jgi:hypothetical protein
MRKSMLRDRSNRFPGDENDRPDDWNEENDEFSDQDLDLPQTGFEAVISPFIGYEVELQGTHPILLQIVRPSTPNSARVLAGVYPDCIVVLDHEQYVVMPHAMVIASVPRAEWEANEWVDDSDET